MLGCLSCFISDSKVSANTGGARSYGGKEVVMTVVVAMHKYGCGMGFLAVWCSCSKLLKWWRHWCGLVVRVWWEQQWWLQNLCFTRNFCPRRIKLNGVWGVDYFFSLLSLSLRNLKWKQEFTVHYLTIMYLFIYMIRNLWPPFFFSGP